MKTYLEAEKFFEVAIGKVDKNEKRDLAKSLIEQGAFYYYCAYNKWSYELNRPPMIENPPKPLKWETSDDFYAFFGTTPKDVTFDNLFEKAENSYKKALSILETIPSDENYPNLFGKSEKEVQKIMDNFVDLRKQKADVLMQLVLICDYLNKPREEETALMDNAEKLYSELGDREGLSNVLLQRAFRERYRRYDMEKTRKYLEEAIILSKETGNYSVVAGCLNKIADTYHPEGMGANIELWEKFNNEALEYYARGFDLENAINLLDFIINYFTDAKDKEKVDFYTEKLNALVKKRDSWPHA